MTLLQRLSESEIALCLYFNRINHKRAISRFFAAVSRLGDGVFWYTIIALLPLVYGMSALPVSVHMLAVGGVALVIYKLLKSLTSRERPYRLDANILHNVPALDLYSFPSGHTMHAVGFSTVLVSYYPEWGWLVVPFAALVALSRLVLGLHFPTDVVFGAALGGVLAHLSFKFVVG